MVDIVCKNALAEVDEILNNTEQELVLKIPNKIRQFIEKNKSQEYETKIMKNKSLNEQNILPETQAILALIYRSYWATEEEKGEFAQKDVVELEEIRQNNNLFKNKRKIDGKTEEITDLIMVQKEKWYQKVWKKLYSLLRK